MLKKFGLIGALLASMGSTFFPQVKETNTVNKPQRPTRHRIRGVFTKALRQTFDEINFKKWKRNNPQNQDRLKFWNDKAAEKSARCGDPRRSMVS